MDFGFTLKPEHSMKRTIALTMQAEAAGFRYGWLFDAHVPFKEVYPLLTLMAINTTHMRLGTCVTNPATREPSVTASALATLDEISGGRMDLGIGRGDSAVRVLGKPSTTMKTLEQAVTLIPTSSRPLDWVQGVSLRSCPGRAGGGSLCGSPARSVPPGRRATPDLQLADPDDPLDGGPCDAAGQPAGIRLDQVRPRPRHVRAGCRGMCAGSRAS
jgi:hypothetical protein